MITRRPLGRGYRWWDRRWEWGAPFTRGDYFIFVEESIAVRSEQLLGPGDTAISVQAMGEQPWRFRSNGIRVHEFLSAQSQVEAIDLTEVTPAERRSRKAQLLKAFGGASLPLIDIFVEKEDDELPFLRAALTPGSWYWIGVRRRQGKDDRLPVYLGTPEDGPDRLSPRSLQYLEAVPPYFEFRLRDIFSLAHVLDVGEEEDFGGEGAPPPDEPRAGDDFAEQPLTDVSSERGLLSGEA